LNILDTRIEASFPLSRNGVWHKEAVFEKPEESSEHLKPLYIRGHIDGKPISRILIDGGATVNLMSYSIFKNLGWEDGELVKINLTLINVGVTR
jgi:hypothetical protein